MQRPPSRYPAICWRYFPQRQRPRSQRSVSQKYGPKYSAKLDEAQRLWDVEAEKIKRKEKPSMLSILEERGYVDKVTGNRDALDELMIKKRIGAYVGVDPTAPSIHVGNLVAMMPLFWLYAHGYRSVLLLGGATAKIGDPTGRTTTRGIMDASTRKANIASMHFQLAKLWRNVETYGQKYGYKWEWAWHRALVNNNTWMHGLKFIEILSLLGKGLRIGAMLAKETVRTKMEKGDGMSFAEFCYPVLQAWDWWHMYLTRRVQVQIGGSDQFGNIVAGVEAIKYIVKNHPDPAIVKDLQGEDMIPYGFTVPILTTSSGEKFGKSAGNAIWLDKDMTSIFELYQFFLRTSDEDVIKYLKLFTFIPIPEIDAVVAQHQEDPSKRIAQHRLARDFVSLVHGEEEAQKAEAEHRAMFQKPNLKQMASGSTPSATLSGSSLAESRITHINAPSPHVVLPRSCVVGRSMPSLLWSAGLVNSKKEGKRLANAQGAYIGSKADGTGNMGDELSFTPVKDWKPERTEGFIIDGNLLILRAGKWKLKIVKIVSDKEFMKMGLDCPGWMEEKVERKGAFPEAN